MGCQGGAGSELRLRSGRRQAKERPASGGEVVSGDGGRRRPGHEHRSERRGLSLLGEAVVRDRLTYQQARRLSAVDSRVALERDSGLPPKN